MAPARPTITIVVARAANGGIGLNGGLPWRLPADMRHFKAVTTGTAMVMGRRTFESLPGLLPGRRHVVLTRDPDWAAQGADVARTTCEARALADGGPISVIGGAEIIALYLPLADAIELTEVHAEPEADTFLAPFDNSDWREVSREDHPAEAGRPAYSFVRLERRG